MKNKQQFKIAAILFLLVSMCMVTGCKKDASSDISTKNGVQMDGKKSMKASKEMSAKLLKQLKDRLTGQRIRTNSFEDQVQSPFLPADFDFSNNLYSLSVYDDISSSNVTAYFVNQNDYNPYNATNYTLFYLPKSNGDFEPVLLKLQTSTLDTHTLEYNALDGTNLLTVWVTDGDVSSVTTNGFFGSVFHYLSNWGGCLADVYGGHHFSTGMAILATAAWPPTAAVYAAACAVHNL